jgi:hypothetical protein
MHLILVPVALTPNDGLLDINRFVSQRFNKNVNKNLSLLLQSRAVGLFSPTTGIKARRIEYSFFQIFHTWI